MNGNINKNDVRTIATKIVAVVLTAILLIFTILFLSEIREKNIANSLQRPEKLDETMSYKGKNYLLKDNVDTILILGLDKFENADSGSYNNNKQADFLLLLVIDNSSKNCKAIQINRDTMAAVNVLGVAGDKIDTVTKQIALSHTYGNGRELSCRNTANAVSGVLMGVAIDHYVSMTMDGVSVFNDMLGGVTLEVMDDFSGIDDSLVKGETVTLMGDQALHYVRSRKGMDDSSNNSRMKRQKQYLEALFAQMQHVAETDENTISSTPLKMADYIVSDCSVNKLKSILDKLSEYSFDKIYAIEGKNVRGDEFMEFYPDEKSVKQIIIECFYEEAN